MFKFFDFLGEQPDLVLEELQLYLVQAGHFRGFGDDHIETCPAITC